MQHFIGTEAEAFAAVQRNGFDLDRVPEPLRTEALCLIAVQQNGQALRFAPLEHRNAAVCLAAVRRHGMALEDVPLPLRTDSLCLAAVQQWGFALQCVPASLRTEALCLIAVQQNGQALRFVPLEHRNAAVCVAAVRRHGMALEEVPAPLRTASLCLAAVQQQGLALLHVPASLRTTSICLPAVQCNGRALEYVPAALRTEALCLAAVQQHGGALQSVPELLRSEALCFAAVQSNGLALQFVPQALLNEALCLAAVEHFGRALELVPHSLRTEAVCVAAVQQDASAWEHVPNDLRGCLSVSRSEAPSRSPLEIARTTLLRFRNGQGEDSFAPDAVQRREQMIKEGLIALGALHGKTCSVGIGRWGLDASRIRLSPLHGSAVFNIRIGDFSDGLAQMPPFGVGLAADLARYASKPRRLYVAPTPTQSFLQLHEDPVWMLLCEVASDLESGRREAVEALYAALDRVGGSVATGLRTRDGVLAGSVYPAPQAVLVKDLAVGVSITRAGVLSIAGHVVDHTSPDAIDHALAEQLSATARRAPMFNGDASGIQGSAGAPAERLAAIGAGESDPVVCLLLAGAAGYRAVFPNLLAVLVAAPLARSVMDAQALCARDPRLDAHVQFECPLFGVTWAVALDAESAGDACISATPCDVPVRAVVSRSAIKFDSVGPAPDGANFWWRSVESLEDALRTGEIADRIFVGPEARSALAAAGLTASVLPRAVENLLAEVRAEMSEAVTRRGELGMG